MARSPLRGKDRTSGFVSTGSGVRFLRFDPRFWICLHSRCRELDQCVVSFEYPARSRKNRRQRDLGLGSVFPILHRRVQDRSGIIPR